jgi:uncharacterized protein
MIAGCGRADAKVEAMPPRADTFDLATLHLSAGEGRRLELDVGMSPLRLGGEEYRIEPPVVQALLDVSRTTGDGYALRLRFAATLSGPCMRCLGDASPCFEVDAREVSQPGEDRDHLGSPYVDRGVLDLRAWARDALALVLPAKVLCREDCAGLCGICGADLIAAGPDHRHDSEPDPRWAKLSELRFE